MKKVAYLFLPLFLLFFSHSYSQIGGGPNFNLSVLTGKLTISTDVPANLTVCGAQDTFNLVIKNISTEKIRKMEIDVDMVGGIRYCGGSVNSTPGGIIEQPPFTLDNPVFYYADTLNPGDSLIVKYAAKAACEVIDSFQMMVPIVNFTLVEYESDAGIESDQETNPESYNILFANLSIHTVSDSIFSGNVGDEYVRTICIINGGDGSLDSLALTEIFDAAGIDILA